MVFSSVVFLFLFLPLVYIAYLIVPGIRLKNIVLILASIIFYAYGEPRAVVLMLVSILVNYLFALLISKNKRKIYLIIVISLNILMLFLFKYLNFFVDSINYIFNSGIYINEIHLPVGISFFTFQAMSYVIDVYRGDVKAQKSLSKLVLFISFFPQLVAGPIIKYHDIEAQLYKRNISIDKTAEGIKRFIYGLSYKLLIANAMGSIADTVFSYEASELYPLLCWIGAVAYSFQIYFDFSGYSSMAIGLGKIFGFDFAENFNLPYISKGIKEFWRRWHISLSTWFKEYVYIPLGGNRRGRKRMIINQIIVFTLTGLWHGANVTFLVWGLLHGFFLIVEGLGKNVISKIPAVFLHIYTMFVVVITFVIFRADNISYGISYICSMFLGSEGNISNAIELCTPYNIVIFLAAFVIAFGLHKKVAFLIRGRMAVALGYGISALLFMLCIINISAATYNPFIYFRF